MYGDAGYGGVRAVGSVGAFGVWRAVAPVTVSVKSTAPVTAVVTAVVTVTVRAA